MVKDSDNTSSTDSGGGCPVAKDARTPTDATTQQHSWAAWFQKGWGNSKSSTTATTSTTTATSTASSRSSTSPNGCPISSNDNNTKTSPASIEEAAAYSQDPHPDQQGVPLSTHRMISSIPRGATPTGEQGPHHQPTTTTTCTNNTNDTQTPSHWMYPSEQQFFHALRKKGWDHVEASTIPSVLEIHNTINERTWKQVVEWEHLLGGQEGNGAAELTDLKLVRFQGRPNDLSPQAFVWTKLLRWADPPFDRHDWYVQQQPRVKASTAQPKQEYPIQRYVIDYYMLPSPHEELPPIPYVDARPALDSPRAVYLRAVRFLQEELPGVTAEYYAWKSRQPHYYDGTLPTQQPWATTSSSSLSSNK